MTHPVLIIGAGGWGREVLAQMQGDPACGTKWRPVGFLDTRLQILDGLDCDLTIAAARSHTSRSEERSSARSAIRMRASAMRSHCLSKARTSSPSSPARS